MRPKTLPLSARVLALLVLVQCTCSGTINAATETQGLRLVPGWNSIWLSVEPQDADGNPLPPETVFASHPDVDIVTRLLPQRRLVEFVQDPSESSLGNDIWLKWRRNTVVGQNTLGSIRGNTPYLIHSSAGSTMDIIIDGEVSFHTYEWVPDSYNFFGIRVGATAPTFGQFFGPSPAHPVNQIFKLSGGQWVSVQENERMSDSAAYWVFSRGGSAYQGPVPFVFPDSGGYIGIGEAPKTITLTAGNLSDTHSTLRLITRNDGGVVLRETAGEIAFSLWDITEDNSGSGTIAPGTSASLRVEVSRLENLPEAEAERLQLVSAVLSNNAFYFQYLPIIVREPKDPPVGGGNGPLPGLWVGDVVISHASSLVEGQVGSNSVGGPRLEPVKRTLRYRVILHSDENGDVQLLEHVTVMQKQRASEDLPHEYVLIVDDSQIPNFVGIEERGGKLVGKRFDTAAYDLPRSVIPSPSEDSNPNFDPSTLTTDYLLTLPLDGALSPGGVVETSPDSLVIDPWHRTNPYKHVFHPDHRKGFRVFREMRFEVDAANSPEAARVKGFGTTALSGVFREEITGLMKANETLEVRGRFILSRVSTVDQLQ